MKAFDKNSPYSFFIKFLLCFFVLYLFFPFYWGITGVGGKMYSSFLNEHLNIIKGLTQVLTGSATFILEALGYTVSRPDYHTLLLGYKGGVSLNPACLGWNIMSFWVAFVFANYGIWKRQLLWMFTGIAAICIINISRIVFIAIANHLQWASFTSLDHHQMFNIFSYCCIFALMYVYISVQKKHDRIRRKSKTTDNKVSTI